MPKTKKNKKTLVEKNKVFQQKGFNIGNLLHRNQSARKVKGNIRVVILGHSYHVLGFPILRT